jgi:SanA protein
MMKMKKTKIKLNRWIKRFILAVLVPIIFSNLLVLFCYNEYIYSSIDSIPEKKVGLLLGTNKYLKSGEINPYYRYRIDAAAQLIRKGKIKYIIVSGDSRLPGCNEPIQMRDDLILMGIEKSKIYLDSAGYRTLDSIMRAKKVFACNDYTIISQAFHNHRAIFIARQRNISAIAFNAKDVEMPNGLKGQVREIFARVKLIIDLFIIQKQAQVS